jgi:hypothetical protein
MLLSKFSPEIKNPFQSKDEPPSNSLFTSEMVRVQGPSLSLKDKYLVQIEESIDIGCPTKERYAEARRNSRMLKFCLFDGEEIFPGCFFE